MSESGIRPGEGGRPWGCLYFAGDHKRAAEHVRNRAPEVFDWLKEHGGFDESGESLAVSKVCWLTAMEILPKATLVDHGNIVLLLRLEANPLTKEQKIRLDDALRARDLRERTRAQRDQQVGLSAPKPNGLSLKLVVHPPPLDVIPAQAGTQARFNVLDDGSILRDSAANVVFPPVRLMQRDPCVYILASRRNGTLYIGVTGDLAGRMSVHIQDLLPGFTAKHQVHHLVYYEMHTTMEAAILREKQLKKWNRQWKIRLIEGVNPEWVDLFDPETMAIRDMPADVERHKFERWPGFPPARE